MRPFFNAIFFIVILTTTLPLYPQNINETLVLRCPDHQGGFFYNFLIVLGLLEYCEKTDVTNYQIDFGEKGHYYEKECGSNWWEYYFRPTYHHSFLFKLCAPFKVSERKVSPYMIEFFHYRAAKMSRKRAHRLIQKHVTIRPEIEKKVEKFKEVNFPHDHFMIGVHFRETDKMGKSGEGYEKQEAKVVEYAHIPHEIDQFIVDKKIEKYTIFVATDSQPFLDYMKKTYQNRVVCTESFRSTDQKPLHYFVNTPIPQYYKLQGQEALIDCLLLSKCDLLVKTASFLNVCASYFNPNFPIINCL